MGQPTRSVNGGLFTVGGSLRTSAEVLVEELFTLKPDYSYTTTDFSNDPTDEVTVEWRDPSTPANPGPDPTSTLQDPGVDGLFVVSASNISGVDTYPTSSTYDTLEGIVDLCTANSVKCIVKIPTGYWKDHIFPTMSDRHVIIWADATGSNGADTWITPAVSGTDTISTTNITDKLAQIELRNINLGTTPDQWSTSVNSCFSCARCTDVGGQIIVRNATCRGATFNAIYTNKGPNSDPGGWNQKMWLYDVEIYNGGITAGSEHNIYIHSATEFRMVRSKSSNSPTHLVKVNGHKVVLIDNYFIDDDPDATDATLSAADATLINLEGWQDLYSKRNIIKTTSNSSARKTSYKSVGRLNGMGGPSNKVPYPIDPNSTGFLTYRGSGGFEWSNANVRPDHGSARTNATAAAGATALTYVTSVPVVMDTYGSSDAPITDLSNTGTDFYRIWVQVKVTATGDYEPHETLATSDNAGGLTLATAIPTGREVEQTALIHLVPDGTALSVPVPNPKMYNSADTDYYWGSGTNGINDGAGDLDKDKPTLYHSQTVEDNAIVLLTGSSSGYLIHRQNLDNFSTYAARTNIAGSVPLAPINLPSGATGPWPDDANAGEWDSKPGEGGAFSSVLPSGGTGIQGSDMIFPQVQYFKDMTYHADAGGFSAMWDGFLNNITGGRDATKFTYDGNANYIAANGTVTSLGDNGNQFDGLTRAETTLSGAALATDTDVDVASATGIVAGMRCHIFVEGDWGATSNRLFATYVSSGYVSGTNIPLDDALPKDAASGARIHFVTAAGANPGYWQTEGNLHPSEEA